MSIIVEFYKPPTYGLGNPKDMASLNNIYKILKDPETNQTSHILQFLW